MELQWFVSCDDSGLSKSVRVNSWVSVDIFWGGLIVESGLIEEESESAIVSGGEILDEDVLEVVQTHIVVGVSIICDHEVVTIFWIRWVMFVEGSIQICDHLSGLSGVHVTGSIVVVLFKDHSGELSGREFIKSSLSVVSSESVFSGLGNLDSLVRVNVRWSSLDVSCGGWSSLDVCGGSWSTLNSCCCSWLSDNCGGGWLSLHFILFSDI